MDAQLLARLRWEQERALLDTDEKLAQWEKFRSDYLALRKRLKTLPDKITHDVMVPFGSLAFMPGQLVHTNEILVLLGDNYFVERSAHQAADIVTRRIKELDKNIEALKKQRELLLPRADFTNEMLSLSSGAGEMKEIVEPYDEEAEKIWRERHREYLQKARQNTKKQEENVDRTGTAKQAMCDEDLWKRLDELELQERRGRELERMRDTEEEKTRQKDEQQKLHDTNSAEQHRTVLGGEDEEDEEEEEEEEENSDAENKSSLTRVIKFSHSKIIPLDPEDLTGPENTDSPADSSEAAAGTVGQTNSRSTDDSGGTKTAGASSVPVVNSPADIYKLVQLGPKSILKDRSPGSASTPKLSDGKSQRTVSFDSGTKHGDDSGDWFNEIVKGFHTKTKGAGCLAGEGDAGRDVPASSGREEQLAEPFSPAKAFTGEVKEKPVQLSTPPGPPDETSSTQAGSASSRPVSKFRASRQRKS